MILKKDIEECKKRAELRSSIGEFQHTVGVESEKMDLWWFYMLWKDQKIDSLETFLQRPLLEKIWQAHSRQKSMEFLTSSILGNSELSNYIMAPTTLVLNECKTWLKEETDNSVIDQLKECMSTVEKKMKKGIKWFILDGQTRSKTSIVPFFESEFALPKAGVNGVQVRLKRFDALKDSLINGSLFKDLGNDEQLMIKSTPIRIDIITSGSLQNVVSALIAKQLNISWTEFQKLYIGCYISAFANRINSTKTGPNEDFFINYTNIDTTIFKTKENGFEYFSAILLNYFKNDVVSKVTDSEFQKRFKPGGNNIPKSYCKIFNSIIGEFIDWAGSDSREIAPELSVKNKLKLDVIRNYIIMRWAMHTQKCPQIGQKIPKGKIISNFGMIDWFLKKHLWLIEKYHKDENGEDIVNTHSWIEDPNTGELIKSTFGYAHSTTSMSKDNFSIALSYLLPELETDWEYLIEKNIIEVPVKMTSKNQLLVSKDWEDRHGNDISSKEIIQPEYHRGHKIPKADNGPNDDLVLQEAKDNLQYGKRKLLNKKVA